MNLCITLALGLECVYHFLADRESIFAILLKIDRSELVCLIRRSSREEKSLLGTKMKTASMSQAGKQTGSCTMKNVGDYRDTAKRGQPVRVGTFPGDNDPLVLSAPV